MVIGKLAVLTLVLLVTVGEAGGAITPQSSNQIVGHWHIVEAQGITINSGSIAVFSSAQVMYRYCNTVSAGYQRKDNDIIFGQLTSTKMACSGLNPDERKVQQAFESCRHLRFTQLGWECYDASNKRVLVFKH